MPHESRTTNLTAPTVDQPTNGTKAHIFVSQFLIFYFLSKRAHYVGNSSEDFMKILHTYTHTNMTHPKLQM